MLDILAYPWYIKIKGENYGYIEGTEGTKTDDNGRIGC
jgi:hypothetical protein